MAMPPCNTPLYGKTEETAADASSVGHIRSPCQHPLLTALAEHIKTRRVRTCTTASVSSPSDASQLSIP